MSRIDDFINQWVDVKHVLPWLPDEPFFVENERRGEALSALDCSGFQVVTVGLAEVLGEEDLMKALGRGLSLASGDENWDSLRQGLHELGDRYPWRIAVIFTDGDVFATKDIHSFVRAVSVLQGLAADLSSILERPYGQLELFYVGQWSRFGGA